MNTETVQNFQISTYDHKMIQNNPFYYLNKTHDSLYRKGGTVLKNLVDLRRHFGLTVNDRQPRVASLNNVFYKYDFIIYYLQIVVKYRTKVY